ncbi:MAG: OmpA family protein [Acetobacteraceae bacterium]
MRCTILLSLTCLCGCFDYHTSGPEAWWHDSIGGKISEQRPPPPGDKDPYPNLATVPPKPATASTAAWTQMTAGLTTDRLNALQAAALAPIPTGSPPAPSSATLAAPPGAGASQGAPAASASLAGVTAPPAASGTAPNPQVSPGSKAPGASTKSGASTQFLAVPATIPAVPPIGPGTAQRVANGQLPALPTDEPARPGVAPPPPPPAVPITATPPPAAPVQGMEVDFDRGSAALNDAALAEVKTIAGIRGDDGVAVTGYGDATTADAGAQSNAVALGLSRAQNLATALVARGVPYARLRLNAEASGRGASLRLLQ